MTSTPTPPPTSTPPASSTPSTPLVWASLILDVVALVVLGVLGYAHAMNESSMVGLFAVILSGRVVAKAHRKGSDFVGPGGASLGGIVAFGVGMLALLHGRKA